MHERWIMPKVPDAPLSLSLTEIALRVGAAVALKIEEFGKVLQPTCKKGKSAKESSIRELR